MREHRKVWGVFTLTQLSVISFLVVAALIGSVNQVGAKQPFILVYYDGHMHTLRSDGSGSVADIKATALSRGLNAVIITDHCNELTKAEWDSLVADTEAASNEYFLALPGFEVTGSEGMFNRDHILAFNVADPFVVEDTDELCPEEVWPSPPNPAGTGPMYTENLTKWVDYIHSKGGIAVHNHTEGSTSLDYNVNNIEVYNQGNVDDIVSYALLLGYSPEEAWGFGMIINNLAIYGEVDELYLLLPNPGFPGPDLMPMRDILWWATLVYSGVGQWLGAPEAPLNSWDDLLLAYVDGWVDTPIFGVANSDAHNTGDPDSKVGVAKNGLYVKELTAKEFYKAIKAGRSFATTGPSLAFDVNGQMMGDTAVIPDSTATIKISVDSESSSAVLVKVDIIKNGDIWHTVSPMWPTHVTTLEDPDVTEDGYYRIEVTSMDMSDGSLHFAWSNPVFVKVF